MKRTGAQIVWECLVREGVDTVFGYPGGAILPIYDAMMDYPSGTSSSGTSRAPRTRRTATPGERPRRRRPRHLGPGSHEPRHRHRHGDARLDPRRLHHGQVPRRSSDGRFQEADIVGITMPITKHNVLVTRIEDLAPASSKRSGSPLRPPGPVLVDVCKDVQQATIELRWPEAAESTRRTLPQLKRSDLRKAAELIASAERPSSSPGTASSSRLDAGPTGVRREDGTPVALTLLASAASRAATRSASDDGDARRGVVNRAIQEADLLLAFGMRFDDRVTGPEELRAGLEEDPRRDRRLGDREERPGRPRGRGRPEAGPRGAPPGRRGEGPRRVDGPHRGRARRHARARHPPPRGREELYAAHVIHDIWRATNGGAIVVSDVGQHRCSRPSTSRTRRRGRS